MAEFLQRLAGSREGCFEGASPKADVVVVCHEVRSGLIDDEQAYISFRVLGRRDGDAFVRSGELCVLKSLQAESVVLMGVWAPEDLDKPGPRRPEPRRGARARGEARIPLRHLVAKCDGALYHAWMMLDSPGLTDSVTSVGLLDTSGGPDASEAFAQALLNAPRQLFQPKACLSILKADDLGPAGQVAWTPDASRKDRIARWGPLLRSQQQHVVMCAAQHLHAAQAQRDQRAQASQRIAAFEEQAKQQARDLDRLRRKLREAQESPGGPLWGHSREATELQQQQACAADLKRKLAEAQEEMDKIGEEANSKIEFANARIRALRQERDEAVREMETRSAEIRQLQSSREELRAEKAKLADQKEALLKIVEDLHQTCISAGLPMSARKSIDSITGYKFP